MAEEIQEVKGGGLKDINLIREKLDDVNNLIAPYKLAYVSPTEDCIPLERNAHYMDKDIFDRLMEEDMEDTEFDEYLDEHYLKEFNGIAVYGYTDLFESIQEDPDNPVAPLIRYVVALVRCAMEDVDDLIRMAKGRYADELEIPMSDVEEEYLEEHE